MVTIFMAFLRFTSFSYYQVEDECGDIPMVLVQNKIDLISQSEIDQ